MARRRECDRDEFGRRIPRSNTRSAQIYALKLAGVGRAFLLSKSERSADMIISP